MNLGVFETVSQFKDMFLEELGLGVVSNNNNDVGAPNIVLKFKDKEGDIVRVTKHTTIDQLITYAQTIHFYQYHLTRANSKSDVIV